MNKLFTFNFDSSPRFRLAPSPTGELHLGNLYVFLWSLVLQHQTNGKMILRIDDTDCARNVNSSEFQEKVQNLLAAFNFKFEFTVRQSERKYIYRQAVEELVKIRRAYYCSCPPSKSERGSLSPVTGCCFGKNLQSGVVRLCNIQGFEATDLIRGSTEGYFTGDIILMRSNGMPTYHLASCVDDFLLDINTIVRSVEWLPYASTHNVIFSYLNEIFGVDYKPKYLHMPILKSDSGLKKLSKRDDARSLQSLLDSGYIPEAVANYLLSISWKYEREIFSTKDVNNLNIRTSNPRFDQSKLDWYNRKYVQSRTVVLKPLIPSDMVASTNFFDLDKFLTLYQHQLSDINELKRLLEKLSSLTIDLIIAELIKNNCFTVGYLKKLSALSQEKTFISLLGNYEEWKKVHGIDSKLIHCIRIIILGQLHGLSVDILLQCTDMNWFASRLKVLLKHSKLKHKIEGKSDKSSVENSHVI